MEEVQEKKNVSDQTLIVLNHNVKGCVSLPEDRKKDSDKLYFYN